jgi:rubrerythrin
MCQLGPFSRRLPASPPGAPAFPRGAAFFPRLAPWARRRAAVALLLLAGLALAWAGPPAGAAPRAQDCADAAVVLQEAFAREMQTNARYLAFAQVARDEGRPGAAFLFGSLAGAELIHARNLGRELAALGLPVYSLPLLEVMGDTRDNLRRAAVAELEDMDDFYPRALAVVRGGACADSARVLEQALGCEMQHRAMLQKIKSGLGFFSGLVLRRIEEKAVQYAQCQNCGSILDRPPADSCPICAAPAASYRLLRRDP